MSLNDTHLGRRHGLTILLFTTLFCIGSWFVLDIPAVMYFRQFTDVRWIGFWKAVTRAGQSEWYLIAGMLIYVVFRKKNRRASRAGLFLFSSVAVSGLAADLLKMIAGRARPKLLFNQGIYGFDGFHIEHVWTSFPSGHSATGLGVAVTLSLLFPRYRPAFMATGVLIAVSRVVLCQHYPSDVVAGSVLGAATAILLYQRYFSVAPDEVRSL